MLQFLEKIAENIPNGLYYLAVGYLVWKVAEFYFVRFREVEKTKTKMDKEINPKLVQIDKTVDKIAMYIITKNLLDSTYFHSHSPVELTDLAKEILEKSGAKEFVDCSLELLRKKIDEKNPQGSLDIQNAATLVIFDLVDAENFKNVKKFIYENPKYKEYDLNVPIIINIAALYLRDKYFEK